MHKEPDFLSYFSRCEHPSVIYNKYTASRIVVNCGLCPACLMRKSSLATQRCEVQSSESRYAYFVTLTYDSRYIPVARVDRCLDICEQFEDAVTLTEDMYQLSVVPRSPFFHRSKRKCIDFKDDASKRFHFSSDPHMIQMLRAKCDLTVKGKYPMLSDYLPYLNYNDFSAFYKRLRSTLKHRLGNYEQIHSYVVGEYGPTTFRPHFHILFFFDSPRVASYLRSSIRSSWPFGRIDVQPARGAASSYCAGYVNSFVSLPSLYKQCRWTRPFGRFSNRFALSFYERYFTRDESSFSYFKDGFPFIRGHANVTVACSRSVVDTFYPKFTNYDHASEQEVYRIVRAISDSFKYESRNGIMDEFSLLRHSRFLYNLIYQYKSDCKPLPDCLRVLSMATRLSEYMPLLVDEGVNAIYRLLVKYRNFVKYWLDDHVTPDSVLFYNSCMKAMSVILSFYRYLNYCSLKDQLKYESFYFDDHPYNDDDMLLFVPATCSQEEYRYSLSNNHLVSCCRQSTYFNMYKRVKHKKLNDANAIFLT
jgi:hypothetical protein